MRKTGKKGKRLKDFIPSNARWFLADLLGVNKTFTEDDLTSSELSFLQDLILNKSIVEEYTSGGKNFPINFYGGGFHEIRKSDSLLDLIKQSYDPYKSMSTTLGQAQLSKDKEGNLIISDNYDFNLFANMTENMTTTDALKGIFQQLKEGNPYKAMGIIAGKLGTSEFEKAGNPVRINLGKSDKIKKRQQFPQYGKSLYIDKKWKKDENLEQKIKNMYTHKKWKKDENLQQKMENFEQQYFNK
tara:strand:+ start:1416 stop:2144 length:729 start_codon:yes stop_codon:yes gene_type:complete